MVPKTPGSADVSRKRNAEVFVDVQNIVAQRCTSCHADQPTQPGFAAPPKGVVLRTPEDIAAQAALIHQQSVVSKVMPIGNLTQMTDEERAVIEHWFMGGAKTE